MKAINPAWLLMLVAGVTVSKELFLDPKKLNITYKACTTKTGKLGKCVTWWFCNENFEIETGGLIAFSELRSGDGCEVAQLCCSDKGVSTSPISLLNGTAIPLKSCTTKNDEAGFCIDKSNCINTYDIEDSELRSTSECNLQTNEVCCSEKNTIVSAVTPETPTRKCKAHITTTDTSEKVIPMLHVKKCMVDDKNNIPWLVMLFCGDDNSTYCLGSMIGSKTILTTANCVDQAAEKELWARVLSSRDPEAKYAITERFPHPLFNSENLLNDVALLGLRSSVEWGPDRRMGACLDPELSLRGQCLAAELINEDLDTPEVNIDECTATNDVSDAIWGRGFYLNRLIRGAPITCPKNDVYILSGITKMTYNSSQHAALLENLDYTWITSTLKEKMGLSDEDFLYELNY